MRKRRFAGGSPLLQFYLKRGRDLTPARTDGLLSGFLLPDCTNCHDEGDPDIVDCARAAMVAHGLIFQTVSADVYPEFSSQ